MMVIRFLSTLVLTCSVVVVEPLAASAAAGPPGDADIKSRLHDDVASLVGRKGSERPMKDARTVGQATAQRFESRYVAACGGNTPDTAVAPEALCSFAQSACQALGEEGVMYWVYRRPFGTDGPWTYTGQQCRGAGEVPEEAVPVFTAADFRRLPLPAGKVNIQPPNGRTLVNVRTNVFVGAGVVTLPTVLLGFPVRVRATPERFVWRFGDGRVLRTADPGGAWPEMTTTHVYTRPGRARVGLTTVYSGEYSVAGGAWLPIDGTAEVVSGEAALTVVAARNELVGD